MNDTSEQLIDACHDYQVAQWEAARDEVVNLATYGPDWDGEGALPACPGLIDAALHFLRYAESWGYPSPADVYLAPDGTPLIEWHFEGGISHIANVRSREWAEIIHRESGRTLRFVKVPIPSFPDMGTLVPPADPSAPNYTPGGPTSHPDDELYGDEVYSLAA